MHGALRVTTGSFTANSPSVERNFMCALRANSSSLDGDFNDGSYNERDGEVNALDAG